MKLIQTKPVIIGEHTYFVRMTNRAMIEYESLTGSSIASLKGTESLTKLFYCTAKAGAKSEGKSFKLTYDEFLDQIDDYYTETMNNFSEALFSEGGKPKKSKKVIGSA